MARKSIDKPRRPGAAAAAVPPPSPATAPFAESGIRPWHLLLVATVLALAAGVFAARGTSTVNIVAVGVAIATAGLVAAAVGRTIAPLIAPESTEQTEMLGGRTRAALEREKMLVLRSIKEVEFDRAMGKISDADFSEMSARLRGRAAGLLRQLDADSSGYRALIERELATRVGRALPSQGPTAGTCPGCGTVNDLDARFCKSCGERIEAAR